MSEPVVAADGSLSREPPRTVTFRLSDEFGPVKPESWTGARRAPGEIQMAQQSLLLACARLRRALMEYETHLRQIEAQSDVIEEQHGLGGIDTRVGDDESVG